MESLLVGIAIGMSLWFIPGLIILYRLSSAITNMLSKVSRVGNLFGPALDLFGKAGVSVLSNSLLSPKGYKQEE